MISDGDLKRLSIDELERFINLCRQAIAAKHHEKQIKMQSVADFSTSLEKELKAFTGRKETEQAQFEAFRQMALTTTPRKHHFESKRPRSR